MTDQDRISQVFKNRVVFITGSTGFLGKILVEKLLRCSEVKKVFLLVRDKKGKTAEQRFDYIFDNVLFNKLKSKRPESLKKCQIISGDITKARLGISLDDQQLLEQQVDFIFHSAASTRFDDSVKRAVTFNTLAVREILDLAERCKKLKVFLHVSTAFAFPKEKILYDREYGMGVDVHKILESVEKREEEDYQDEELLKDYPNTYTFSKALAERLVVERMNKIPAVIVRPSVVCPIWGEPVPGWCNNLQGPMGLFVGAGKGIIRTMYMKEESHSEFVPADLTINGILAVTWNYLTSPEKPRFVNLVGDDSKHRYTWKELIETGKSIIQTKVPFNGAVWYPGGSIKNSKFVHNICFYLFQMLPAVVIDALLVVLGYKPILFQIQKRIQKGCDIFEYYTNKNWSFSDLEIRKLNDKLNTVEKEVYKIDAVGIELTDYLENCVWSVRRNNLKESDESVPGAKRHMKIMWALDFFVKFIAMVTVAYYGYKAIKSFHNV